MNTEQLWEQHGRPRVTRLSTWVGGWDGSEYRQNDENKQLAEDFWQAEQPPSDRCQQIPASGWHERRGAKGPWCGNAECKVHSAERQARKGQRMKVAALRRNDQTTSISTRLPGATRLALGGVPLVQLLHLVRHPAAAAALNAVAESTSDTETTA